jgi:competence protein ComEC
LLLAAVVAVLPRPVDHPRDALLVEAIDVGQGDSILLIAPDGKTLLVDGGGHGGGPRQAPQDFDIGEEVVSQVLWSRGIRRLDAVVLTHAHSDHMGGMPAVLRNFRPRELWVAVDPNSATYRALLAEATTLGIRVRHLRAGDTLAFDSIAIHVLAPTPDYTNPGPPINNDSLVMRLTFGHSSALLEGDAEAPSEHQMVAAALTNPAASLGPDTLLKVGHHGSRTSTTPEFLALVAPQDAVISVGLHNTFGHPSPEVIQRLHDAQALVFRTDQFGITTFLLSRDGQISALTPASYP